MGLGSSSSSNKSQFVGASSGSSMGPDGQVQVYHDTFSGVGQNGQYSGNGYFYHNMYPTVVSVISVLAIIMIVVVILCVALAMSRTIMTPKNNKNDKNKNKLMLRPTREDPFADMEMKLVDNQFNTV